MEKILVNEIIKKYQMNNSVAKNAPTNNAIIKMLQATELKSLVVEPAKSGAVLNRGSVVECVVRYALIEYILGEAPKTMKKSTSNEDFNTKGFDIEMLEDLGLQANTNYEIKLLSSIARASYEDKKEMPIIMVDLRAKSKGVYLVEPKDLVLYNPKSISDYTKGTRLDLVSELLGI